MRRLTLWRETIPSEDKITWRDFLELLKRERAFALVGGPNCAECDVLKSYIRESGADRFVKYYLDIPIKDEALEEAQAAGILHIPFILDCYKAECEILNGTDPLKLFEELVRRLVEVYKLAEVDGGESL